MIRNILTTLSILLILSVAISINHFRPAGAIALAPPSTEKIVLIRPGMNGIGNQLFQFAAGHSLAKRLGAKLWIVGKHSNNDPHTHTKFSLDAFIIPYDKLLFMNSSQLRKAMHRQPFTNVDESNFFDISTENGNLFYLDNEHSYFSSEKFFRGAETDIFNIKFKDPLPVTEITTAINNLESVAVHLRLGDFVTENRVIPITFQLQAMEKIRTKLHKPHFFIFSDDIDFATKSFAGMADVTIASAPQNSAITELNMMAHCKHIITANSTFSWWAAYLIQNPKKIVIAPEINNDPDAYPSSWLVMNPHAPPQTP